MGRSNLSSATSLGFSSGPAPWIPSDKSGLLFWYRADQVTVDGSNNVLTWPDLSPNNYTATPEAAGPKLVPGVIGGHPIIRFTAASSHRMNFAGSTALVDKNTTLTMVIVKKASAQLGGGNFGVYLTLGASGNARLAFFNAEVAGYEQFTIGGGTAQVDTNCGVTTFDYYSSFYKLVAQYDGTGAFSQASKWSVKKDGVTQTLVNGVGAVNTSATSSTMGSFGPSGLFLDGDVADVFAWNSPLSVGEEADLYTYLSRYF